MSLLILSIEYILLSVVFESMRDNNTNKLIIKEKSTKILSSWNPLSYDEWNNIRSLTGGNL